MGNVINELVNQKKKLIDESFRICSLEKHTPEEKDFIFRYPQLILELEDRIEDLVKVNNTKLSFPVSNIEKLNKKVKLARQAAYMGKYRNSKKRINIVVEAAFYKDISLLALQHEKTITRVLRDSFKLYQEKFNTDDLC